MNGLGLYGKILKTYQGSGILSLGNEEELGCDFDIAQFSDARLYAICRISLDDFEKGLDQEVATLAGKTNEGHSLSFNGLAVIRNDIRSSQVGCSRQMTFVGGELRICESSYQESLVQFKFLLTNFALGGKELQLDVDGSRVVIFPVPDYSEIVRGIKAQRVDVTCEARIETSGPDGSIVRILDGICTLLTLAQGCRIQWICYEKLAPDGGVVERYHKDFVTKPYGTLQLIANNPMSDLQTFVNQTYPHLQACEQNWGFRKTVDAYTDAKIEEDFLELRALKMAIVMEHLKGLYLLRQGKLSILNQEAFEPAQEGLEDVVQWALRTQFPNVEVDKIKMMATHTKGLNSYPFGRALSDLCKSIGLQVTRTERRRFVEIRNDLVHRMSFAKNQGSEWEQYRFMMTFIGKILITILEYDGHYYDWTETPGWVGENTKMRRKLDRIGQITSKGDTIQL